MQIYDRHLVRRCLAGDRKAFDALYERHAARVFHLLRRLTGDEAEAEDLTQETLLTAYRSLGSWRGEGAFGTWLCGIAYRLYANARRRRAHELTEPLDDGTDLAAPDADPLMHCLRRERDQRIEAAITALPPLYREVFILVQVEGLSGREAAEWLDVPPGTLRWRLWRAVCLLQVALADLAEAAGEEPGRPARRTGPDRDRRMASEPAPECPGAAIRRRG